ncbi:hypothetical protein BKA62DRAFT_177314 [Auriculariales sp. MPI-PUGE-AT-0066]|nr:hypothetical protein BKA62DRAFT_177314 [Auriculariales sp. MPI-PUGE-AT-0066]
MLAMSATFQLPSTFTVGEFSTKPLIDVAQVRAHVVLLGLFFKLRKTVEAEGKDWVSYIRGAVDRFGEWAQKVDRESYKTPALDVAMVWHTYMLNPLTFARDAESMHCLKHLDGFPTVDLAKALSVNTITTGVTEATGPALPFGIDLIAAVQRQGGFIEKVDRLGWTANGFFDAVETANGLISGIARYHAFLDLLTAEPGIAGVPTMDIDLAWHTHQLMGETYRTDTEHLIGHAVDHDDDVDEAGGDEVMEEGFDATAAAWKARFGVAYESNGKE